MVGATDAGTDDLAPARFIPMKLVGLAVLAALVLLFTGLADPIGIIESQLVDPVVTGVEDWLSGFVPW